MDTAKMTQTNPSAITPPEIDISSPEVARKSLPEFENWIWVNFQRIVGTEMQKACAYARCVIDAMRFENAHKSEAMKQAAKEAIDKLKEMFASGPSSAGH